MTGRPDLIPTEVLDALSAVGAKLRQGDDAAAMVKAALEMLATLNPGQVARADWEIADAAGLHRRPPPSLLGRLLSPRPSDTEQLSRTPGLEYLFLFHRDGRLREAALLKIQEGLASPFLLATVIWRLNDWVPPVREAAVECANRSFPLTDPGIVASVAAELLVRQASWGRWRDERAILERTFARRDVAERLAELIKREKTGPRASTLRHALRTPALDRHLDQIVQEAVQPAVRAVALHALIEGRAEWPSGTAWQWLDKSMGLRRRIPVFDRRPLTVALPREALIARGVNDRSALVRRVALAGIIRHLLGTTEACMFAGLLAADRSPSVRERAAFILRAR